MTTIIVTNEENQSNEFRFEPAQSTITLGRRSTNDVCIPDLSVSGSHASISFKDGQTILEDLNSTNGTYVNGQVIQRAVLQPDDEVIIGKILLNLVADASTPVVVPDADTSPNASPDTNESDKPELAAVQSLRSVDGTGREHPVKKPEAGNDDAHSNDIDYEDPDTGDTATAVRPAVAKPTVNQASHQESDLLNESKAHEQAHPLDGLEHVVVPAAKEADTTMHELDSPSVSSKGAVIEIRNGAKSGQILPIDKPVTTLGRPGIQIAAIMRKPDGYFLMHIESDDTVDRPTLNRDTIGDEPVLLHSGDELTVAGIDVAFMLS